MQATRRGFLGWLAALFSGCYAARDTEAVDCVRVTSLRAENGWQPVEAEPVCGRPVFRLLETSAGPMGAPPGGYADAWDLKPIQEQLDEALRVGARHACIHSGWKPVAVCSQCDEAWAGWNGLKDKAPRS